MYAIRSYYGFERLVVQAVGQYRIARAFGVDCCNHFIDTAAQGTGKIVKEADFA